MPRITLISILILCGFVLPFQAQAQDENLNSIFWEISHPKHTKTSYLFGTHHLHDYQFIENDPSIQAKVDSADVVVGEIVIGENQLEMMIKLAQASMLKGKTLQDILSEEEYEDTDKCLKDLLGMGVMVFNNRKPIFIYQLIMVAKVMKIQRDSTETKTGSIQNLGGNSMDEYFQKRAQAQEKELAGLETIDDQLKVLYDGYSVERQKEMLLDMVYDRDNKASEELLKLNKLYQQQDITGLYELMQSSTNEDEQRVLLNDRNVKWVPQIEQMLKAENKSAFIAVGAGHLPGDFGLIKLLRDRGFQLKPLKITVK